MARRSSKARRHPKTRPQGVLALNVQGFGFVKTAEGEFFIPASKVNGAFPGDMVEVARLSGDHREASVPGHRPSARVTKVLLRARDTLIGRYEVAEPFGVVVPEDPSIHYDVFTLRSDAPHVLDGSIVEVQILEFPTRQSAATGRVLRVLGDGDDVDIALDLIIAEHQFETQFSPAALQEADRCQPDTERALVQGYRNLQSRFIFTIDPVNARDFDDAVSIMPEEEGYCLGVHIADVSRFVPYDSSIDCDARRRATSVYLVDRVLPMLPEHLSNDVCSLVPGVSRCSITVEMHISLNGSIRSYEVFPSVIQSSARLSYDQAQALLDAPAVSEPTDLRQCLIGCEVPQGARPLSDDTLLHVRECCVVLNKAARALLERRKQAGCMEFDRVEAKVRLDAHRRPVEIYYRRRSDATQMIEEAMIAANQVVAQWLLSKNLPAVFRVHGAPDGESLYALYQILQEFSLFKDIDKQLFCDGNPFVLQEVLRRAEGLPQQELIHSLVLRAMKRARYQTEVDEHYGLALDAYCHFTSPIRRYPDLLVHRMCKEAFFGHSATYEAQKNALSWMAEHSSKMEREAEKAARDSQLVKIIEYLERYIGTTYDGVIAQVSTFGVKVRLECSAAGLIAVEDLGEEYFSFDPYRHVLTGVDTGRTYRLGQRMRVRLLGVHPRERRLDLKRVK